MVSGRVALDVKPGGVKIKGTSQPFPQEEQQLDFLIFLLRHPLQFGGRLPRPLGRPRPPPEGRRGEGQGEDGRRREADGEGRIQGKGEQS